MLDNGFVMLHRSILNWEWYTDYPTRFLFEHLLLTANWEDKKWQGKLIKRGQRLCSVDRLTQETALTRQQLRTAIKHLTSTGEITTEPVREKSAWSTLFTVNTYEKYQSVKSFITDNLTTEQPQNNHGVTADQPLLNKYNKDNKDNKDNKVCRKPTDSESLKKNYSELVRLTDAQYDSLVSKYGREDASEMIEMLDSYKKKTGRIYNSDYSAIQSWVCNKLAEERARRETAPLMDLDLSDFTEKPW